jgi:GAF domain
MTPPYAVPNRELRVTRPHAENERSQTSPVTANLAAAEKLDRILNILAARALLATGATSVAIGLTREDNVICRATGGLPFTKVGDPINSETGLTGMAIRRQMSQWSNDTESDPRVDIEACRHFGIRSIILVPIQDRDAVIGIFAIFSVNQDAFSLADVNGVKGLAEGIAEAIEHTRDIPPSRSGAIAIADSKHSRGQQPVIFASQHVQQNEITHYAAKIWRALARVLPGSKNGRTG